MLIVLSYMHTHTHAHTRTHTHTHTHIHTHTHAQVLLLEKQLADKTKAASGHVEELTRLRTQLAQVQQLHVT